MEKGKSLENKFQKWCKELDIYHQRFYDSRSFGRVGSERPSDYWIFIHPDLFLVECKETQAKNLAFDSIRPSQYKGFFKALKHKVIYIVIVSFNGVVYAVRMASIVDYIRSTARKSMPLSWFKQNAVLLKNKKDLVKYLRSCPKSVILAGSSADI